MEVAAVEEVYTEEREEVGELRENRFQSFARQKRGAGEDVLFVAAGRMRRSISGGRKRRKQRVSQEGGRVKDAF